MHLLQVSTLISSFNTQPPEGGWRIVSVFQFCRCKFQHTAARRRLARLPTKSRCLCVFQHTAARRRLGLRFQKPKR